MCGQHWPKKCELKYPNRSPVLIVDSSDPSQAFCYSNGSEVGDSLSIATYLGSSGKTSTGEDEGGGKGQSNEVYFLAHKTLEGHEIVQNPPFVVNFAKWQSGEGAPTSQGSVNSSSFPTDNNSMPSDMSLAGLRKRIPSMFV